MRLTPPKQITFWVVVILAVLGVVGAVSGIAFLAPLAFWLEFGAVALLILALLVRGL
jgi:hypothetical protein